jgi:predicted RNA-binding protein associated with RNAse of E/G family
MNTSNTIDFAAARVRLQKQVQERNTYVDVEFDVAELEPSRQPIRLIDLLMDVARDCGGVATSVADDLGLGR